MTNHSLLFSKLVLIVAVQAAEEEDPYQRLTAKEKDILKLLAEGHTSREIADLLHVSLKTVNGHHLEIRKKLDLSSRADLLKYAIRRGLVSMDAEPPFHGSNGA